MKLVTFDLDGTLVESMQVDVDCYVRSFEEAFGIRGIDTHWEHYEHATDSWIGRVILERHLGREPEEAEIEQSQDEFLMLLQTASVNQPDLFLPVPDADVVLPRLSTEAGWRTALATGGWRETSLFKLNRAGISHAFDGSAYADDALTREEIMALARARAERAVGETAERSVYVGDAVWDVRACRGAGIPFVGIGRGANAQRLRDAGAAQVLPDYRDFDAVGAALQDAVVPT